MTDVAAQSADNLGSSDADGTATAAEATPAPTVTAEAQVLASTVVASTIADAVKVRTQMEQKIASLEQPIFQEAHDLIHSDEVSTLISKLQASAEALSSSVGSNQLKHLTNMIQSTRTILSNELLRLGNTLAAKV